MDKDFRRHTLARPEIEREGEIDKESTSKKEKRKDIYW